jgi:hypothetical protein
VAKKVEKTKKKIGATAKDLGFKYGVTDLADRMSREPATVRQLLRSRGIKKEGSVYGWNGERELAALAKDLLGSAPKGETKKPAKKVAAPKKTAPKANRRPREEDDESEDRAEA